MAVYGFVSTGRGLFLRESVAGHWFPLPSHSHLGSIIILDNLGPWLDNLGFWLDLGWTLALFHFQDLMKNLWVGLEGGQGRASLGFNLFPVIAAAGAAAQCRPLHTIDCRWRKTIQIQIQNTNTNTNTNIHTNTNANTNTNTNTNTDIDTNTQQKCMKTSIHRDISRTFPRRREKTQKAAISADSQTQGNTLSKAKRKWYVLK